MHLCLDEICKETSIDNILVDGNKFKVYYDNEHDEFIDHSCIIKEMIIIKVLLLRYNG